jgi:hypothetical protein
VSDYQEEFWGVRGPPRHEERVTRQADNAIAILTPLLEPDENLAIWASDAWSFPFQTATVATSGQRVFVVFWDRQARSFRVVIADGSSVRERSSMLCLDSRSVEARSKNAPD